MELVLGVTGFAVILVPAVSALAQVASARAAADDAALSVARAWSIPDSALRWQTATGAAAWLERRSVRRLRILVRCDVDCANPAATAVITASVATGLRYPAVVSSVRRMQGDRYAP